MESLKKRLHVVLHPVSNDLDRIKNEILNLEKEIIKISRMENKVGAVVRLFQTVSPLQDKSGFHSTIVSLRKKNYGQLDFTISTLEILQGHLNSAGRDIHGMNRTKIGEEVTPENVFLGDVFGLNTKPASYWILNQKKCEEESSDYCFSGSKRPMSVWDCINGSLATKFVKSHTEGILTQIEVLKNLF